MGGTRDYLVATKPKDNTNEEEEEGRRRRRRRIRVFVSGKNGDERGREDVVRVWTDIERAVETVHRCLA